MSWSSWKEVYDEKTRAEEEKSKKYLNSCANGYFEIVLEMFPTVDKSLREHGLSRAACNNQMTLVKYFIEAGVDPNGADSDGTPTLYGALKFANSNLLSLLLEKGANPNISDQDGWTVVHRAALNDRLKGLKLLVQVGGKISYKTSKGKSPLEIALSVGNKNLVIFLREVECKFFVSKNALRWCRSLNGLKASGHLRLAMVLRCCIWELVKPWLTPSQFERLYSYWTDRNTLTRFERIPKFVTEELLIELFR